MARKSSEFVNHLEAVLKHMTNTTLAKLVDASDSRIPEWRAGKRLPSPDTLIKLGKVALEYKLPDPFFFWALAGVDTETLRLMAHKVQERRDQLTGPTVPISRFRETSQGREEAGPPIPLPSEFIPNPDSTVCFVVDKDASAVLDSPHAIFILDETDKNASNLLPFWGKVVFAEYDAESGTNPRWRSGIYAGRLAYFNSWPRALDDSYAAEAEFYFITGLEPKRPLELGWKAYPELKGSTDIGVGLHPLGENPLLDAARQKVSARAASELRLSLGWRILGHVIGRLSMSGVQNVARFLDAG
jgi:hypothetical protein